MHFYLYINLYIFIYILIYFFSIFYIIFSENIDAKLCYLGVVSSCNNPSAVLSFKHLLSPPGSKAPCESLDDSEFATK